MRELFILTIAAGFSGALCLFSLVELVLTVRRRRKAEQLQLQIRDLKGAYTESINKLVLEQELQLEAQEKAAPAPLDLEKARQDIEEEMKGKYEGQESKDQRALKLARTRARKLEDEAKEQADQYLSSRKKEIEEELMGLVISVSKKVLPAGISYDAQKELVMQALREVKTESR